MASLIDWLSYSGARKSDGTVVASGSAYFYQPGTTSTQVSVYSDKDGTSAITQPVALDAGGRAEVYVKTACRIEIQDSAGTVIRVEDRGTTISAAQVEIENSGFTGTDLTTGQQTAGGRTDLNTQLGNLATSIGGTDGQYKEEGSTTSRAIYQAIGRWVSPSDCGAVGNDANDDTAAFQAAITRAMAANKGLWIEPGTYRITSGLTVTGSSGAGLIIAGADRKNCIIKNMSTSATALTIDLSSAIESHIRLENFTITAGTTSSGSAIKFTNGDGPMIQRVNVALHRIGFDVSSVSHVYLEDCLVTSSDSNAASKGFKLGSHATAVKSRVTACSNGIGFSLESTFANVRDCKVIAAASGTGIDISAANCSVLYCFAGGATTGINVGATSLVQIIGNKFGSNTTDLVISASVSSTIEEHSNAFSTMTDGGLMPHVWLKDRSPVWRTNTVSGASGTFTPDPTGGKVVQLCAEATAGAINRLIGATATTGLVSGQIMVLVFSKVGGGTMTITGINAQYIDPDGSAMTNPTSVATATAEALWLFWNGTAWQKFSQDFAWGI